jgi:hypothetical protein
MAVTYYLAMGGKLDLLLNLDGHNEMVDIVSLDDRGIHPSYPLLWHWLSANAVHPDSLRAIGKIGFVRQAQQRAATWAGHLRYSLTATAIWDALDRALAVELDTAQQALADAETHGADELPAFRTGPRLQFTSRAELYEYGARVWLGGSLQLDSLTRGAGAQYVHFIQPNQHVPGSKPLTEQERRTAFNPGNEIVAESYPYLERSAATLRARGVNVHSLVELFEDTEETLYEDACCHLNRRGNRLLAEAMATRILTSAAPAPGSD